MLLPAIVLMSTVLGASSLEEEFLLAMQMEHAEDGEMLIKNLELSGVTKADISNVAASTIRKGCGGSVDPFIAENAAYFYSGYADATNLNFLAEVALSATNGIAEAAFAGYYDHNRDSMKGLELAARLLNNSKGNKKFKRDILGRVECDMANSDDARRHLIGKWKELHSRLMTGEDK